MLFKSMKIGTCRIRIHNTGTVPVQYGTYRSILKSFIFIILIVGGSGFAFAMRIWTKERQINADLDKGAANQCGSGSETLFPRLNSQKD